MSNPPHHQADLMMQYAQDAAGTDRPWELWEYFIPNEGWLQCTSHPRWGVYNFRRKPYTIKVGSFNVSRPAREPLQSGQIYYTPTFDLNYSECITYIWTDYDTDKVRLARGLVHLTKEDASLHTKALLSFTTMEDPLK